MNPGRLVPVLFAAIWAVSCAVAFDVGPPQSVVGDGGPAGDAGPAVDAPRGPARCPVPGAELCADFESAPVESGWDEKGESNGGTVALDSTHGSQSASCRSVAGESDPVRATLVKKFTGARPLTVEFDTWITTPNWSAGPNFAVVAIEFGPGAGCYLVVDPNEFSITTVTPDFSGDNSPKPFPYERWVHVSFTVDWNARSASVSLDGEMMVTHPFTPTKALGSDSATSVEMGFIGFNPPEPGVTVNIDNVVITRH